MTVTRDVQGSELKTVYKFDGSETKSTLTFGGNAIDQVSKAKWDGNKLVVSTSMDFGGNAFEIGSTFSLDATGSLVVEQTRPDFQGGGAPVTTKSVYKKG